ncbi:MAG: hypothetical protein ABF979_05530 [Gluconobacter sp.]
MKFYPLVETAVGSGRFALSGSQIVALSTSEAIKTVAGTTGAGLRAAVSPYRSLGGMPDPVSPQASELGSVYDLLIEKPDEPGIFVSGGQILSSQFSDAALLAISMQLFYGSRAGLVAHVAEQAVTPSAPTESVTSGAGSSGSASVVSGGSSPVSSGGTVVSSGSTTSGGTVTSAGAA